MERTSRGGGWVQTHFKESQKMRRNGEKFYWDRKVFKPPRDDEIPQDFSPINDNVAPVSFYNLETSLVLYINNSCIKKCPVLNHMIRSHLGYGNKSCIIRYIILISMV